MNPELEQNQQNQTPEISHGIERHMPVIEQLSVALGILVLVFGTAFIPDAIKEMGGTTTLNAEEKTETAVIETAPVPAEQRDAFESVSIEAKSAFVWDVKDKRMLYSKNPDEKLPLASLAKLMTALVAYEVLGDDATVSISAEAIAQEGDSGFGAGELFTSRNLLDLTLINSSNDGAFALAAAAGAAIDASENGALAFVRAMNFRAEELGLAQTSFRNPTGLDVSPELPGAEGSARDMAFLMEYLLKEYPETLELTRQSGTRIENEQGLLHDAENTNRVAAAIPGLLGSKTGYTALAGGNLVIAYDAGLNHPIIIAVLGSSREGRFSDVAALVEASRAEVTAAF